jgi:methionyl-tRNA formyltransferase
MSAAADVDGSLVLLLQADGRKSRIVFESLCDSWVTTYLDVRVVVADSGPVLERARRRDLPATVASTPRDPMDAIRRVESSPDYVVTCGWPYKVPPDAIDAAERAALNCHSSYLPDYRGLSVFRVQWAHAEDTGGATVHHLTESFDEGDIVCQERFHVGLFDTPLDIIFSYSQLTAVLLREAILLLEHGHEGTPQPEGGRYYSRLSWPRTLAYGIPNHLLRLVGSERRIEVDPDG